MTIRWRGQRGCVRAAVGVACVAAWLSGCAIQGLQFRTDDRLEIVAPRDRTLVSLPTTIAWRIPRGVEGWSRYAVFLDTSPMPFGKNLRYLARYDKACQRQVTCPDTAWLEDRGVYVTSTDSVRIETLKDLRRDRGDARDEHEAVVVPISPDGDRIGEYAYYIQFYVSREQTS